MTDEGLAAQRDLLKSAREMMADARRQIADARLKLGSCFTDTVEIMTLVTGAPEAAPKPPAATGWECPKCGRVYSPQTAACGACNEEPAECMK